MGRNAIVASICPQLHGMFAIKLALLLMLVGGLTRVSDAGMHIRGDIHMLLVGDPGTGSLCSICCPCIVSTLLWCNTENIQSTLTSTVLESNQMTTEKRKGC